MAGRSNGVKRGRYGVPGGEVRHEPMRHTMQHALELLVTAAALACTAAAPAPSGDLARVTANVRQLLIGPQVATGVGVIEISGTAAADLKTLRPDGSWPDLVYTDTSRYHWLAGQHLPRLERITRDFYRATERPPATLDRIRASLAFWLAADPHNVNWWHNQIGVPRQVGSILMMLGDDAPPDLRHRGAELMRRANWEHQAGANLLDETWIGVMRACLSGDDALLAEAFRRSWAEVHVVPPGAEGIQADGSFHQHGPLLYNRGYGTVLLEASTRLMSAADGTALGPPPTAAASLGALAVDGDLWMARGGTFDFGASGRGICRVGGTAAAGDWKLLHKLADHPGPRSAELAAAIAPGADGPVGNRHFWRSDYMVQRRPDYFASVRMYSSRTFNTDPITNGENMRSHHIADGATCVMLSGREYFDIYPVWDWLRIPGTTVEQDTPFPQETIRRMGPTSFVGGASDGSCGCAAMDLSYGPLAAHKAWFCFDRQVVCLGTGIACDTDHPVVTTLNQCLLNGPVYADGDAAPLPVGHRRLDASRWLWHDSVGYVLPVPAAVELSVGPQHGAWADIGLGPPTVVERDVFSAAIDHGRHAHDGSYAYVLLPGSDRAQTAAAAAHPAVEIIANTPPLQAVWHAGEGRLQAVFHAAGAVAAGGFHVRVDAPCLLMVHRTPGAVSLCVANPLNAAAVVTVWTDLPIAGDGVVARDGGWAVRVALPGGDLAGQSVVRTFTLTGG
jgi:chondroitin AC lyase